MKTDLAFATLLYDLLDRVVTSSHSSAFLSVHISDEDVRALCDGLKSALHDERLFDELLDFYCDIPNIYENRSSALPSELRDWILNNGLERVKKVDILRLAASPYWLIELREAIISAHAQGITTWTDKPYICDNSNDPIYREPDTTPFQPAMKLPEKPEPQEVANPIALPTQSIAPRSHGNQWWKRPRRLVLATAIASVLITVGIVVLWHLHSRGSSTMTVEVIPPPPEIAFLDIIGACEPKDAVVKGPALAVQNHQKFDMWFKIPAARARDYSLASLFRIDASGIQCLGHYNREADGSIKATVHNQFGDSPGWELCVVILNNNPVLLDNLPAWVPWNALQTMQDAPPGKQKQIVAETIASALREHAWSGSANDINLFASLRHE